MKEVISAPSEVSTVPVLSCSVQEVTMNYLLAEEGRRRLNYYIGLECKLADKSNPLENLTPEEVKRVYRFHPDTIVFLLGIVSDDIEDNPGLACESPDEPSKYCETGRKADSSCTDMEMSHLNRPSTHAHQPTKPC